MTRIASPQSSNSRHPLDQFALYLWLAYLGLLVYGTLFPLTGWEWDAGNPSLFFSLGWPRYSSTSDVLLNVLVFVPLGFLTVHLFRRCLGNASVIALAVLGGGLLSTAVEYMQMFLPGRVSSPMDILLNTLGSLIGAVFGLAVHRTFRVGRRLFAIRRMIFQSGPVSDLGLLVAVAWIISQLIPLVPSLDMSTLRHGVKPLWLTLNDPQFFQPAQAITYTGNILALCLIGSLLVKPSRTAPFLFPLLIATTLVLKIPVVSRQLSAEALAGLIAALVLYWLLKRKSLMQLATVAGVALVTGYISGQLAPAGSYTGPPIAFNWIPFASQVSSLTGVMDILSTAWPFFALAYLMLVIQPRDSGAGAIGGGILVVILTAGLEWVQLAIPGRHPDITDTVVPLLAWALPSMYPPFRHTREAC